MKKLILLIFFIALFFIIIPSTLAVCCEDKPGKEGGCYPGRGICCEEADKNVGYIGCESDLGNKCPGEFLGPCLQCSADCKPDGTNCVWKEIDKCSGLSCVIEYVSGTKIPSKTSECTNKCMEGEVLDPVKNECIEVEDPKDATCTNTDCASGKFCCGSDGTKKEDKDGKGSICSGDNDKDNICNYYDNCEEVPNSETLGTCLPSKKTTCTKANQKCGEGETCSYKQEDFDEDDIGDACETINTCTPDEYTPRQCCDTLPGNPLGVGTDFGKTKDCNKCFTSCVSTIKDAQGNEVKITFDISPCIDGQRTVTKLQDGEPIETPKEEPCSGIPLIPFFTNINLIFTLLILTLFYYFREK